MPVSRGGGHSGGGGHGGGGFSFGSGSGKNKGPRFSQNKRFPGAIRYYYINPMGIRRSFYYGGVPKRTSMAMAIVTPIVFVIAGIILATVYLSLLIPTKLKPTKCIYSGAFVSDTDNLLTDQEEQSIADCFKAFYDKTGIEPYLYMVDASNFEYQSSSVTPQEYLRNYAYDLYLDTFNDEGHYMILFAKNYNANGHSDWWVEMAGNDTTDLLDDDVFESFKDNLDDYIDDPSYTDTQAIVKAFDEMSVEAMKVPVFTIIMVLLFILVFMGFPVLTGIESVKQIKEINAYCDYRDKNGGEDFIEKEDSHLNFQFSSTSNSDDTTESTAKTDDPFDFDGESNVRSDELNVDVNTENNSIGEDEQNAENTHDADDNDSDGSDLFD